MGYYDRLSSFAARTDDEADLAYIRDAGQTPVIEPTEADAPISADPELAGPGATVAKVAAEPLTGKTLAAAREVEAALQSWLTDYKNSGAGDPDETAVLAKTVELARRQAEAAGMSAESLSRAALELHNGLWGLERYLDDPEVSDILINRHDRILIERAGRKTRVESPFRNKIDLMNFVSRLAGQQSSHGLVAPRSDMLRVNAQFPWTLTDGTTVNVRASIQDASLSVHNEMVIALRKPTGSGFDDINTWATHADGCLTPAARDFLVECFRHRANILLVGGTGSGKTSLMKGLIRSLPTDERLLVAEQSNELVLDTIGDFDDYVGLVTNPGVTLAELIQEAMRLRPDRIIVGECRMPGEVSAFLEAVNTGHAGSITTTHASSANHGLQRLLTLAAQDAGSKAPIRQVATNIFDGIDLVVFLNARPVPTDDGGERKMRRVVEIATVERLHSDGENAEFVLQYVFNRAPLGGEANDFFAPLVCQGPSSLSHAFKARMEVQGLGLDRLEELTKVSPSDQDAYPR